MYWSIFGGWWLVGFVFSRCEKTSPLGIGDCTCFCFLGVKGCRKEGDNCNLISSLLDSSFSTFAKCYAEKQVLKMAIKKGIMRPKKRFSKK